MLFIAAEGRSISKNSSVGWVRLAVEAAEKKN